MPLVHFELHEAVLEGLEHAEAEQVDLDDAEVGAVLLVPLHDATIDHARRLDRHHLVEPTCGDHDAARVLTEVTRQAAHPTHQLEEQSRSAEDSGSTPAPRSAPSAVWGSSGCSTLESSFERRSIASSPRPSTLPISRTAMRVR